MGCCPVVFPPWGLGFPLVPGSGTPRERFPRRLVGLFFVAVVCCVVDCGDVSRKVSVPIGGKRFPLSPVEGEPC